MGILTNRGEFKWHVASDKIKKLGRLCADYCEERNIELGKLAVWYTAQLKGPATFLVGMPTTEILAQNLDVFTNNLTQMEMKALNYCLEKCVQLSIIYVSLDYVEIISTFIFPFHRLLSADKSSHWEGVEIKQLFNR